MAHAYFAPGMQGQAVFELFVRRLPTTRRFCFPGRTNNDHGPRCVAVPVFQRLLAQSPIGKAEAQLAGGQSDQTLEQLFEGSGMVHGRRQTLMTMKSQTKTIPSRSGEFWPSSRSLREELQLLDFPACAMRVRWRWARRTKNVLNFYYLAAA